MGRCLRAGGSGGAALLEALPPEAAVRPDAASGGAVVGLQCSCEPASFLEVVVGRVRLIRGVWPGLTGRQLGGHTGHWCMPTCSAAAPVLAAALPPLPGPGTRQAVLDGALLGRPRR